MDHHIICTQELTWIQAIEKGNLDGAKIYAQNAIRAKNLALNYLRLSSRVDAVASRVESAVRMCTVTTSMAKIVRAMELSMQSMNLEQITRVMDKFEGQFEDLDIQGEYVEKTINQTTALTTPQEQVNDLIALTAEIHNIDLKEKFTNLPTTNKDIDHHNSKEQENDETWKDELLDRLSKLKAH